MFLSGFTLWGFFPKLFLMFVFCTCRCFACRGQKAVASHALVLELLTVVSYHVGVLRSGRAASVLSTAEPATSSCQFYLIFKICVCVCVGTLATACLQKSKGTFQEWTLPCEFREPTLIVTLALLSHFSNLCCFLKTVSRRLADFQRLCSWRWPRTLIP